MPPKCVARPRQRGRFKPTPPADSRANSVRAHNPTGGNRLPTRYHTFGRKPTNGGLPQQRDAQPLSLVDHFLMQHRPPQANALPRWKISLDLSPFSEKANSTKSKTFCRTDGDTEVPKSRKSIRHQSFPTGFVDGRFCAIRHNDLHPSLARGDCSRKSSRPTADDKHVRCSAHPCSSTKSAIPDHQHYVRFVLNIDGSLCQAQRLGPKRWRRVHHIHDTANSRYEFVDLIFADHQRWRHFQHHEIVPANLRQHSLVAKHPHHHDLTKHRGVNGPEGFERNFQGQPGGRLEFDSGEHAQPADFLHHFE